jgi:tetratricopeptide (TPR) repeat protein
MTLAGLGARRYTGQLTVQADARQYRIAFDHGAVVGATSPLASDAAARVALLHHLIAPAQLAELTRRITAAPGRDEIEVLAEAARLTLDQALRLRRKVIEQRAARTFSIAQGELVIDSKIDVPILRGLAVDVRSVIYLGARMNLPAPRLSSELRRLGVRFVLAPQAAGELGQFGFTEAEQPILEALRTGASVAELEARHRDLDPRTIRAVIYALAACAICASDVPPPRTRTPVSDLRTFRQTPLRGLTARTPTPTRATVLGRVPTSRGLPVVARPPAPAGGPAAARDAYRRGEARLRAENLEDAIADLTRAVELAPGEADYAATLVWARFCHAANKQPLAEATRHALDRARRRSATPEVAQFYLGRVERMLGRDREALRHFQEILEAQPRHADAAAEVRAIEARMAQAAARARGLFGRKR